MDGALVRMGDMRNAHRSLAKKTLRGETTRKTLAKVENTIKMH